MTTSSTPAHRPPSSGRPVRIALAGGGRHAHRRLESRLGAYHDRVEVLRERDQMEPDLALFDPCTDGRPVDLATLAESAGDEPRVVVYTSAPAVDPLAFAMAGSMMDGRLRGWLSQDLSPEELLDALERIHGGDIVVAGAAAT